MKSNIILLIIGMVVLIATLFISYISKEKRAHNKIEYYHNPKEYNKKTNIKYKIENEIIFERIKKLEQEILQIKQENEMLKKEYKKNNILQNEPNQKNNSFKPILNYNLFKEKNSNIIDLYKKGKSKEAIAKELDKSIREIEMVLRLVE